VLVIGNAKDNEEQKEEEEREVSLVFLNLTWDLSCLGRK